MKITILFLAVISISLAFVASNEMCRNAEVKVTSSIQNTPQTFTVDIKKIWDKIAMGTNGDEFNKGSLVPLEQVGMVLEKTASSKVLDAKHHKYLRNEPEEVWLPYSYTGDWTRNGYVISTQLSRTSDSKTETPLVNFEFVNDVDLMSISSKDMDQFQAYLQYNSQKRKIIKIFVKTQIGKYQDLYLTTTDAKAAMKASNANKGSKIVTMKATLQTTITEITTLTTKITTLEATEAGQAAALKKMNDDIDDIIGRLVILNVLLKKREKELSEIVPKDKKYTDDAIYYYSQLLEYPKDIFGSFLQEYSISTKNRNDIIVANYKECNKVANNVAACKFANDFSSQTLKKLRRGF